MANKDGPFIDDDGRFTRGMFKGRHADEVRPSYVEWVRMYKPADERRIPDPEPACRDDFDLDDSRYGYTDWRLNPNADTEDARQFRGEQAASGDLAFLAIAGAVAVGAVVAVGAGLRWAWRKMTNDTASQSAP